MAASRREILGDDLDAAISGYQNGRSFAALGRELSCTPLRVKRALLGAGIELRSKGTTTRQKRQPAIEPDSESDEVVPPKKTRKAPKRETENYEVEEPPRPKAAPVDKLDKKRDKSRKKAGKSTKGDPDDFVDEDEAELDEGLAAYGAGVDDEGHVDRILALAAKLRRKGKLSARQYTKLVNSVLDPDEDAVSVPNKVPAHTGGEGRRAGVRPDPSDDGLQAVGREGGRAQLRDAPQPEDPRLRACGVAVGSPGVAPRVDALSAILAGYKGR